MTGSAPPARGAAWVRLAKPRVEAELPPRQIRIWLVSAFCLLPKSCEDGRLNSHLLSCQAASPHGHKHDVKLFFIYNTTANSFSNMLYMGPVVNPSFRSKSM